MSIFRLLSLYTVGKAYCQKLLGPRTARKLVCKHRHYNCFPWLSPTVVLEGTSRLERDTSESKSDEFPITPCPYGPPAQTRTGKEGLEVPYDFRFITGRKNIAARRTRTSDREAMLPLSQLSYRRICCDGEDSNLRLKFPVSFAVSAIGTFYNFHSTPELPSHYTYIIPNFSAKVNLPPRIFLLSFLRSSPSILPCLY